MANEYRPLHFPDGSGGWDTVGDPRLGDTAATTLSDAGDYTDQEVATRALTDHDHTRAQVSDASALGRTLMAVADAQAGREALDLQGRVSAFGVGAAGIENLVPNPRGRNTSGTVTVRENLAPHPNSAVSEMMAYTASVTSERSTEQALSGTHSTKATANVGYTRVGIQQTPVKVEEDDVFYMSVMAYIPSSSTIVIEQARLQVSTIDTRYMQGPFPRDEWFEVSATSGPPGTATDTANVYIAFEIEAATEGAVAYFDHAYISTSPGKYFDGDTSPDTDLTAEWTGTPGESSSRLVAPKPIGYSATAGALYYSERGDSLAFMPFKGGTSPTAYVTTTLAEPLPSGTVSTTLTEAWTSSPGMGVASYLVQGGQSTAVRPLGAESGTIRRTIRRTGTTIANASSLVAMNTANAGTKAGDIVYFRAAVVPGEYAGRYFDGHTVGADWDGGPDSSVSVWGGDRVVDVNAAQEALRLAQQMNRDLSALWNLIG